MTTSTTSPPTNDNDQHLDQFSCIYFGFASNLSLRTIRQRCPSATYAGLAALKGWKFIVSSVGFGNIIRGSEDDIVYGSLNFLSKRDEDALDRSEEVPQWHQKMTLKVTRLANPSNLADLSGQEIEVMTYVDVERVEEGAISKDYIVWLRKAVADGIQIGVPQEYFEKYVNRFLPRTEDVSTEEQIMMIRTMQMDKENTGYVPSHMLRTG